ncbi:hypothetical protein BASA62_005266 [Batrachochytrium salamandrivorans]|nr:hypothetical protein BASA62_005266 [Batrachochytrium salamandrivorans]
MLRSLVLDWLALWSSALDLAQTAIYPENRILLLILCLFSFIVYSLMTYCGSSRTGQSTPNNLGMDGLMMQERSHDCFYCGVTNCWQTTPLDSNSKICIDALGRTVQWLCPACGSVNSYDPSGDIVGPEGVTGSSANTNNAPFLSRIQQNSMLRRAYPSKPVFCDMCIQNQQLVADILRDYDPLENEYAVFVGIQEDWEESYLSYKASLESRYPIVCNICAPHVRSCIESTTKNVPSEPTAFVQDQSCDANTPSMNRGPFPRLNLIIGLVATSAFIFFLYRIIACEDDLSFIFSAVPYVYIKSLIITVFVWTVAALQLPQNTRSAILLHAQERSLSRFVKWIIPIVCSLSSAWLIYSEYSGIYLRPFGLHLNANADFIMTILHSAAILSVVQIAIVVLHFGKGWRQIMPSRSSKTLRDDLKCVKLHRRIPSGSRQLKVQDTQDSRLLSKAPLHLSQDTFGHTPFLASTRVRAAVDAAQDDFFSPNALDVLSFKDDAGSLKTTIANQSGNADLMDWEGTYTTSNTKSSSNLFAVQTPQMPVPWHMQVRGPRIIPQKEVLRPTNPFSVVPHSPRGEAFRGLGYPIGQSLHNRSRPSFGHEPGKVASKNQQSSTMFPLFQGVPLLSQLGISEPRVGNRIDPRKEDPISEFSDLFASKAILEPSDAISNVANTTYTWGGNIAVFICGVLFTLLVIVIALYIRWQI